MVLSVRAGVARAGLVAASLAVTATGGLAEAEHKLLISAWAPPTHGLNSLMWPRFIEMVEAATDGRVTAEVRNGLAAPPAQIDLVQDGGADLGVVFHGYQPGRFVATKLIELPGYAGSAEAASVAYWRVYEQYLAGADEHRGLEVIALHTHGPAQLHSDSRITALDQLSGLKVRVPGGVAGDVGAALGVTGIQVPAPKVYETLASGAADGVVMPFESRVGFRLTEVAGNVYQMPGGFYRGSFAYVMNPDALAALPADLQQALRSEVFGEPLSRALGRIWDRIDAEGRDATPADNITVASDADVARFEAVAAGVREKVLADIGATGVDARAAYEMVRQEMAAD